MSFYVTVFRVSNKYLGWCASLGRKQSRSPTNILCILLWQNARNRSMVQWMPAVVRSKVWLSTHNAGLQWLDLWQVITLGSNTADLCFEHINLLKLISTQFLCIASHKIDLTVGSDEVDWCWWPDVFQFKLGKFYILYFWLATLQMVFNVPYCNRVLVYSFKIPHRVVYLNDVRFAEHS